MEKKIEVIRPPAPQPPAQTHPQDYKQIGISFNSLYHYRLL